MSQIRDRLREKYGDLFVEPEQMGDNQPGYFRDKDVRPEAMIWNPNGLIDVIIDAKSGRLDVPQGKAFIDLIAQRAPTDPPGRLFYLIPEGPRPEGAAALQKYAADKNVSRSPGGQAPSANDGRREAEPCLR
jgi:hypothetical protein